MATKKKETKPPVELDNRKYVVDRLLATKREGMERES